MTSVLSLDGILGLVGTLDDSTGEDTPRQRFRRFLRESVTTTGAVRDYIEACVRNKGPQYDHALQDLVNHAASLIGFEVEFGRYRGVTNDIGHDGLWRREDFTVVAEVKTTDTFAIKTAPLVGYVDRLISEGRITDWDHAMGLYIVGRTDSDLIQLAHSIVAEKRTHQLRIATADTVLSLAELVQDQQITPDEAVDLLRPASVFVTDTVQLLARVAARSSIGSILAEVPARYDASPPDGDTKTIAAPVPTLQPRNARQDSSGRLFLITPVSNKSEMTAKDAILGLLQAGWYVFGESTPGRKRLKPGDRMCFYESGVGVVAEAEVASRPEKKPPIVGGFARNLDDYPWSFRVTNPRFFFDYPIVIDSSTRSKMDAFTGRDLQSSWSWFVQGTRSLSEHDFLLLTGHQQTEE